MSWATCYSGCDNAFIHAPPRMNDGRLYTTWQPEGQINKRIQDNFNIHDNWTYRQFMQHNANKIIHANSYQSCRILGLECNRPSKEINQPSIGYESSDLKREYLTRTNLQKLQIAPCIKNIGPIYHI